MEAEQKNKVYRFTGKYENSLSDGRMKEVVEILLYINDLEYLFEGKFKDYYVYERFIKDTGEIFYVGIGREDEHRIYRENEFNTERIKNAFDTDIRLVEGKLSAKKVLFAKEDEIERILCETDYVLTDRNGNEQSSSIPAFQIGKVPVFGVTKADEHYFNCKLREFDAVEDSCLAKPAFVQKGLGWVIKIYGGEYERYYNETLALLEQNGGSPVKSRYAKSVTSWIYPGTDSVINFCTDEMKAEERLGRRIPVYHLLDVWRFLKEKIGSVETSKRDSCEINPVHNRIPLSKVKNRHDRSAGFDEGFEIWKEGEAERKAGNIEKAIQLFDTARSKGYLAPVLYDSYAVMYRKLKDFDNEIDILNEVVEVLHTEKRDNSELIIKYEERKKKVVEKLRKRDKK